MRNVGAWRRWLRSVLLLQVRLVLLQLLREIIVVAEVVRVRLTRLLMVVLVVCLALCPRECVRSVPGVGCGGPALAVGRGRDCSADHSDWSRGKRATGALGVSPATLAKRSAPGAPRCTGHTTRVTVPEGRPVPTHQPRATRT